MRRFSTGVVTDNHPLYGPFLSQLSACIFDWTTEDADALRKVKRAELVKEGIKNPTKVQVKNATTKAEMALHCRRTTVGAEETRARINRLLDHFTKLSDLLGVPLIHKERMAKIWKQQQQHLECIQDPPNVQLYTELSRCKKTNLRRFRCARGSVSVESFHLHQNRFIPGRLTKVL